MAGGELADLSAQGGSRKILSGGYCRTRVRARGVGGTCRKREHLVNTLMARYLNKPARNASVSAAPPAGDCAALGMGAVMAPGVAVLAYACSQAGFTLEICRYTCEKPLPCHAMAPIPGNARITHIPIDLVMMLNYSISLDTC